MCEGTSGAHGFAIMRETTRTIEGSSARSEQERVALPQVAILGGSELGLLDVFARGYFLRPKRK